MIVIPHDCLGKFLLSIWYNLESPWKSKPQLKNKPSGWPAERSSWHCLDHLLMWEGIQQYLLNISMGLSPSFPPQRLAYDHTLSRCLCWNHISNKLFSSPYSRVYFLVRKIKIRNVGVGGESVYMHIYTHTYIHEHITTTLGKVLNLVNFLICWEKPWLVGKITD